jgi:hypothetical protein
MEDKHQLIADIKEWVKLAKEIFNERKEKNYNILFDIVPVENFEIALTNHQEDNEFKEKFLEMYSKFCLRILDSAEYESKSGRISDSFTSLSKTCYLMDLGFSIVSDILIPDYSKSQRKEKFELSQSINNAYEVLFAKRNAIYSYIDPFAEIYTELEESARYAREGYKLVELFGLSSSLSAEEYTKLLDEVFAKREEDYPKLVIRDVIYEILEKNNLCFKVSITEGEQVLFDRIGVLIPEFKIEEYNKEYLSEKEFTKHKFRLFGENVELDIPYSGGKEAIVEMINPLIEKNVGKSIVAIERSEDVFVVVPSDKKEELLSNSLFFEQMH